jgi:hypothetical protein
VRDVALLDRSHEAPVSQLAYEQLIRLGEGSDFVFTSETGRPIAAMTGHSEQIYDAHSVKPFRDAEEHERVRQSLASIGSGNGRVDERHF